MTPKHIHTTHTYEVSADELLDKLGIEHDSRLITGIQLSATGDSVEITLGQYHSHSNPACDTPPGA